MQPADIENVLQNLRAAAKHQRARPTDVKNSALLALASALLKAEAAILRANAEDLQALPADTSAAFRDRLLLNPQRLTDMAESLRQVASLPDPVGEIVEAKILDNGLRAERVRSPLGVIFMIFESRPNVIVEAFSLAFKSGNVILLRGGSESRATAAVLYAAMRESLKSVGLAPFYGMDNYDRRLVEALLKRKDFIDIVVPRGGDKLIEFVGKNATMPIIKNDRGLCHAYIEEDANLDMAVAIVVNGKMQRPGVCNSLETLLVHEKHAPAFLPQLYAAARGLQWRVDSVAFEILKGSPHVNPVSEADFATEYLDLILNVRVVGGLTDALAHIEKYGSKHSEVIVTSSEAKARIFQKEVDAAAVYWNASTRFTDGFSLGLGGELGISTQKLHVRGPVGLRELTTPRWIFDGTGQIR